MENIKTQRSDVLEHVPTSELVSSELLKFYKQMNEHNIKFSDIFSALFKLQNEVSLIDKKVESSIARQNREGKSFEKLKDSAITNIEERPIQIELYKELEDLKKNVKENTLDINLIKEHYIKRIEILTNTKKELGKKHQIQKEASDCTNQFDKMDNLNKELAGETHLHTQLCESIDVKKNELARCDIKNQEDIKYLKNELINCKACIQQQREILKSLERTYFKNTSNEELKTKLLHIQKENDCKLDDFNQTIQELKKNQRNVEEIVNVKTKAIQKNVNKKIKQEKNVILSKVHQLNQNIQSDFQSLTSDLHSKFCSLKDEMDTSIFLDKMQELETKLLKSQKLIDDTKNINDKFQNFDLSVELENSHNFIELKKQLETTSQLLKQLEEKYGRNIDECKLLIQSQENFIKLEMFKIDCQLDALFENNNNTPLHHACQNNQITEIENLLQMGADINAINEDGDTALHIAVSQNHLEAVKILVSFKADVNAKNRFRITPLMMATEFSMLKFLLESDADPNIDSSQGLTALYFAILNKNHTCVQILLDHNAETNIFVEDILTAYTLAVISKKEDIINLLKQYDADIKHAISPEKVAFLLFYNITSMFVNIKLRNTFINILRDLLSYSNFKNIIGKSGFIFILQQHLNYYLNFQSYYSFIEYIWNIMSMLTESEPVNCISLVDYGCMNHFITSHNIFSQYIDCLEHMIDTMNNISEVKILRQEMMNSAFLLILIEISDLKDICKHSIIKLFGHLLSDCPDAWTVYNPSKETMLEKIENLIDDTPPSTTFNGQYKSLKFIFELINDTTSQVQLCGAWLLANIMHVKPEIYYSQISELDGLNLLQLIIAKNNTNKKVNKLIKEIIKIIVK